MAAMAGCAMVHRGEQGRGAAFSSVGQRTSSVLASRMSFSAAGRVRMGAGSRRGIFCSVGRNGARSVEAKASPITFHVGETLFTMPFSLAAAKGLNEAISGLFQTFKGREGAGRPQRWKTMEFRQTGEDGVYFEEGGVERREMLRLGSAVILGSTLSTLVPLSINKSDGGVAYAADIGQRFQRAEFLGKVKDKLRVAVKASPELVPDLLKLALNDALTYDKATKTGGANGSIRFELNRPENAGLEKAVKFLEGVKADLDESLIKFGSISYADLIQLAAQSATKRTYLDAAIAKCGGNDDKGNQLYTAYGSNGQWGQFDKNLGRTDATGPDPEGRIPIWDKATPAEISAKFAQFGIKPRYVAALSIFLGAVQADTESKLSADAEYVPYVKKYQDSRKTVSQTDYEVDLINTFSKLSVLGQSINYEAYTYKGPPVRLRF